MGKKKFEVVLLVEHCKFDEDSLESSEVASRVHRALHNLESTAGIKVRSVKAKAKIPFYYSEKTPLVERT